MAYQKDEAAPEAWLAAAHGANDSYSGFLKPLMPFIAANADISMAAAAIILSTGHIFGSILQPLFGFFADRAASRGFVFFGLLGSSIFIPLAAASSHTAPLVLFVVLGALGSSFFHPQALRLVHTFTKGSAVKNMGIFMALGMAGAALGPLFAGFAAQSFGLSSMPWLSLFGIAAALSMFLFLPKVPLTEVKKRAFTFREAFGAILKNRELNILNLISMLKSLMTTSCTVLLPFQWKAMGYPQAGIGLAIFFFVISGALANILSPRLERKIGTHAAFYFSLIGTLPLMAGFYFTYEASPILSFVLFALTGFVANFAAPVTMSIAQSVLPQYKAVIGGFINGFSWGVIAILMTGIAYAAQRTDIPAVLFALAFVPALFSFLVRYIRTGIKN